MFYLSIGLTILSVFMTIICNIKTNAIWEGVFWKDRADCKWSEYCKEWYKDNIKNSKKTFVKYTSITSIIVLLNIVITSMVWKSLLVIPCALFLVSILAFILIYAKECENIITAIMVISFILALISLVVTLILSGYETSGAIIGGIILFIVVFLSMVDSFS